MLPLSYLSALAESPRLCFAERASGAPPLRQVFQHLLPMMHDLMGTVRMKQKQWLTGEALVAMLHNFPSYEAAPGGEGNNGGETVVLSVLFACLFCQ